MACYSLKDTFLRRNSTKSLNGLAFLLLFLGVSGDPRPLVRSPRAGGGREPCLGWARPGGEGEEKLPRGDAREAEIQSLLEGLVSSFALTLLLNK